MKELNSVARVPKTLLGRANPVGDGLPGRIVLRRELASPGVELLPASFVGQWLQEQDTSAGIAGSHNPRHHFEVLTRLLLRPGSGALVERLQAESMIRCRMTYHAAGMAGAFLKKDRL